MGCVSCFVPLSYMPNVTSSHHDDQFINRLLLFQPQPITTNTLKSFRCSHPSILYEETPGITKQNHEPKPEMVTLVTIRTILTDLHRSDYQLHGKYTVRRPQLSTLSQLSLRSHCAAARAVLIGSRSRAVLQRRPLSHRQFFTKAAWRWIKRDDKCMHDQLWHCLHVLTTSSCRKLCSAFKQIWLSLMSCA